MATHTSILSRRIPTDRGAWWVIVHGIAELDMTEQLSTRAHAHTHTHASRGGGKLELRIANTARISKQVAQVRPYQRNKQVNKQTAKGTDKHAAAAAAAKSLQSCPTLCDPINGSPPGSAVPGILQARTLEWVAISFSNA